MFKSFNQLIFISILCIVCTYSICVIGQSQQHLSIALLIGNTDYKNGNSLETPINDINAINLIVSNYNFHIIKLENPSKVEMEIAMEEFRNFKTEGIKFYYYAGHTVTINQKTYLIPANSNIKSYTALKQNTIDLDAYLNSFNDVATPIFNIQGWYPNNFSRWLPIYESNPKAKPVISLSSGSGLLNIMRSDNYNKENLEIDWYGNKLHPSCSAFFKVLMEYPRYSVFGNIPIYKVYLIAKTNLYITYNNKFSFDLRGYLNETIVFENLISYDDSRAYAYKISDFNLPYYDLENIRFFSFPAPVPSDKYRIYKANEPSTLFNKVKTFGDIDRIISGTLKQRSYNPSYYIISPDENNITGFAIATNIEQFNPSDYSSKSGDQRFDLKIDYSNLTFGEKIKALFFKTKAHFRVFVFAITNQELSSIKSDKGKSKNEIVEWIKEGNYELPSFLENVDITDFNYSIHLLVYEYVLEENSEDAFLVENKANTAIKHLEGAKLEAILNKE